MLLLILKILIEREKKNSTIVVRFVSFRFISHLIYLLFNENRRCEKQWTTKKVG